MHHHVRNKINLCCISASRAAGTLLMNVSNQSILYTRRQQCECAKALAWPSLTRAGAMSHEPCHFAFVGCMANRRLELSPDRWIERKVSDPISLILPRFLALSPLGGGLYGRAISFEIPSEKLQVETEDIYKNQR